MTFNTEHVRDFIKFSSEIKQSILSQTGCLYLDILQDINNSEIFFSHSRWQSEEDLNIYRASDFFRNIWPKARIWFADKPQAWSLIEL
jgi:quinol monooxygenase YgiN